MREVGVPAADVVTTAFDALGQQPSVIHGWFNWLRATSTRFGPRSVVTLAAEQFVMQQTPAEMQ